jgi:hypothetical protein
MKKLKLAAVLLCAAMLLLTACSSNEESVDESPVWVMRQHANYVMVDGLPYPIDFEGEMTADIIVIGEFIDESRGGFGFIVVDEVVTPRGFPLSFNRFRITEVLQGDIEVGDVITIRQGYAICEYGLLHSDEITTPMNRGDRWIYFLRTADAEAVNEYFKAINHELGLEIASTERIYSTRRGSGRYPLPNDALMRAAGSISWTSGEQADSGYRSAVAPDNIDTLMLGVYIRDTFDFGLYAEILEHFGLEARDWVNPGQQSDARLRIAR